MATMEVKQAVRLAKVYIADLYEGEDISDIGLEEVDFSDNEWRVTIGCFRPWERHDNKLFISSRQRSYKVVRINDNHQEVAAVKNLDISQ